MAISQEQREDVIELEVIVVKGMKTIANKIPFPSETLERCSQILLNLQEYRKR